ncbi:MAG: PKD domain-containing protein [Bacteroidales bacterium]|jgi:PKD repeat protein|nr:PKD domain-containing protein [Bacteroidales bacterium]
MINALTDFNKPEANFTTTEQIVSPNSMVLFTSTSSNDPSTYFWTFTGGSPTISTQRNPKVQFATYGSHSTKLVIENKYGKDSILKKDYILVPEIPVATFTASNTTITPGESVTFTSTSSNNPTNYIWDFGTGSATISTENSTSFVYTTQGSYTVSLSVSNVSGTDTETKKDYIGCN